MHVMQRSSVCKCRTSSQFFRKLPSFCRKIFFAAEVRFGGRRRHMSISVNMSDIEELLGELEEDKNWSKERTKLLIVNRLEYEEDFASGRRKKSVLWRLVLRQIKNTDPNFPFLTSEIVKKYNNLFTTYKRVKKRNQGSGQGRTNWDFFQDFDSVLGTKHVLNPPQNQIFTSFELENADSNCSNVNTDNNIDEEHMPSSSRGDQRSDLEIADHLKKHREDEERRHREFIDIEKEKCQIEKEKLKILNEVKAMLQDLIEK